MEIISQEEAIEKIHNCANSLIELQLQKKAIDEEIKELKQSWKEDGVAVGKVMRCANNIKRRAKMTEADKFEEDMITDALESSEQFMSNIAILNS